jgi:hypothetical protein
MTAEQFNIFWASNFAETIPIQHYFKHDYAERWFRIHSLPESKRYADNDQEWNVLLNRHNEVITDLFGNNANLLLVTGDYNYNSPNDIHITNEEPIFNTYSFTILDSIDLHKLSPDEYDEGQTFRPAFSKAIWNPNIHDALLKAIANDGVRAFFISLDNKVIVAPYDGGIDFILNDTATRDIYKQKYKEWLSEREDGF